MRCVGIEIVSTPSTLIDPLRTPVRPRIARSVLVRPAPLRPSRRHHLAAAHVEVDAVQDMRLAVPGVQVADLEGSGLRGHVSFAVQCPLPASSPSVVPMYASRTAAFPDTVA